MNFIIYFNPDREYEDEALLLARRLFAYFDTAIDSLSLIPSADEDLALLLDGRLILSLTQTGRSPKVSDVLAVLTPG